MAVVIPILLFAAGAEAREFESRTHGRRGLLLWEQRADQVKAYLGTLPDRDMNIPSQELQARSLELRGEIVKIALKRPTASELLSSARGVAFTVLGLVWALTVFFLALTQILILVWLGQPSPRPDDSLATMSLFAIIAGLVMMFLMPLLRLTIPGSGSKATRLNQLMPVRESSEARQGARLALRVPGRVRDTRLVWS
ncbi:hypothetical protein [Catenulispora rubra]|uniref:hypothetical protein n=1 Tax=Catenulispora rubra TaxID=280293 RepID=UPI00189239AD|nr:hypothetical protein [Catenulispora rubra]